ncbi:ArsR family transcriptional regulator [Rhodophyticola sp. CCM32]|uniref:ArsR/SmtB family transcription factor n=1 Tax=Rhodophyticola sp. CCM32 TaxID=2916397 RepID=UPI00107FA3E1|nr:winged helix-turn-helix domain-containing protein [Rhodophyticola sp. CCM32]QBY01616.1 ArsR family transcriptional regulator [Rhodophyticola sp. CCM32]
MKEGPDIASVATLIGDPARANILTALMDGRALTASELAAEAGVTAQTASTHLAKLVEGGLLSPRKQGRHKYFALAHQDVAGVLEGLMGLSAGLARPRTRTGPRDDALREARICYNHLAGRRGIQLFESLTARGLIDLTDGHLSLTGPGADFITGFGVDLARLQTGRSPLCRECLDWSERRTHLAGSLGRALWAQIEGRGWARRDRQSRAVLFTPPGKRAFDTAFPRVNGPGT